ncbi:hypothetical protein BaRGS_00006762 [Batillaria attramentaria]|uniref:Uncharacterized protein n=1 Tax=Batillaria attramentaria TaxID=370345 RepID=A0ABD0LR23_9CAEN
MYPSSEFSRAIRPLASVPPAFAKAESEIATCCGTSLTGSKASFYRMARMWGKPEFSFSTVRCRNVNFLLWRREFCIEADISV